MEVLRHPKPVDTSPNQAPKSSSKAKTKRSNGDAVIVEPPRPDKPRPTSAAAKLPQGLKNYGKEQKYARDEVAQQYLGDHSVYSNERTSLCFRSVHAALMRCETSLDFFTKWTMALANAIFSLLRSIVRDCIMLAYSERMAQGLGGGTRSHHLQLVTNDPKRHQRSQDPQATLLINVDG